jgi:hypothetical protein
MTARSLDHYKSLSDEELLEAAKYERPSPEMLAALAHRLDDIIDENERLAFRLWEYENEKKDLNDAED